MIKHIVAWTFTSAPDKDARVDKVVDLLTACSGLPGVESFALVRPQAGLEASFDLMLESTFTDADALAAYARHPLHKAAGAYIAEVREQRWAMDYDPDAV